MKIFGNESTLHDSNLGWEGGIERPQEHRRVEACDDIRVGTLTECMHPGIRSSGAVHPGRASGHLREGGFNLVLNGILLGLTLPAAEEGAVVGNDQFQAPALRVAHDRRFVRQQTPALPHFAGTEGCRDNLAKRSAPRPDRRNCGSAGSIFPPPATSAAQRRLKAAHPRFELHS